MAFLHFKSIQTKIVFWTGLSLVILAGVIIAVAVVSVRNAAIDAVQQQIVAVAESEAARIEAEIEVGLDTARALAQAFAATKSTETPIELTRDQVNGMLRQILQDNPQFLGTYTVWEPNAFDNQDARYANTPAHDATGRFIPYWVRDLQNRIHVEPLLDYETPGIGDYYVLPKQTKQEQAIPPYLYPIAGQEVLMSSLVVPIMANDRFYGMAGVDFRVDFLQQLANQFDLYDGAGQMVLISSDGALVGVTGRPDLVGQPASNFLPTFNEELWPQLQTGQPVVLPRPEENSLLIFEPIRLGQTQNHWTVGITVPLDKVTTEAWLITWRLIGIGAVLTILALILLWFVARQIAQPLKQMTGVAQAITAGNLAVEALVKSEDEVGVLAKTFNLMAAQLRDFIRSLEQRVADRTRALEINANLSRQLSTILDQEQLLSTLVEETQAAFNYYHVHIYLLDSQQQRLVVVAGTGPAGAEMKAKGHNIPLNAPVSLIARAARTGQVVRIDNVRDAANWLPNPLLPDTYSEMAVPINLDGQVEGVLDVQQNRVAGLDEGDANLLRALANQAAIAIRNARQFKRVESALTEARAIQKHYLTQAWEEIRVGGQKQVHLYSGPGGAALPQVIVAEANRHALSCQEPTVVALDGSDSPVQAVVAPVELSGQTIGALQLYRLGGEMAQQDWTEADLALVAAVLDQVAQTADNLRLFEEIRQQAAYESLVGEISQKLRQAPTFDILAQTAAEALGNALGVSHSLIKVGVTPPPEHSARNGEQG